MGYFKTLSKAVNEIFRSPIVLLPKILYVLFFNIFSLLLYRFGKFSDLHTLISNLQTNVVTNLEKFEPIFKFFQNNIVHLMVSFCIFVIATFIVGSGLMAFTYYMLAEIVKKRKFTLYNAWKKGGKYFWKIVLVRILIYLISVLFAIFIGVLAIVAYKFTSKFYTITLASIALVFLILGVIILKFGLMFSYAILFLETKNPFKAIYRSFLFFKKRPMHVFYVWLVILLVNIAVALGLMIFNLFSSITIGEISKTFVNYFMSFFALFVGIFTDVLGDLYIFLNLKS